MSDINPTIQQQFLHVPGSQREGYIQPNCIADDLRWEAMAGVHDRQKHRGIQILLSADPLINLTIPKKSMTVLIVT